MIKFKLQSVLKLREQTEEAQKRVLGKLRTEEAVLQMQKEQLGQKIQEAMREYEQATVGIINVTELDRIRHYLKRLDGQKKELTKQIQVIADKIIHQQMVLREAMKDRKILENLKEIKVQEYLEEEKQKEQLLTDELVSYKYNIVERSDSNGKH